MCINIQLQMEIENVRRLVEKMQEDNADLERERAIIQMEGVRERMLIMERVESLSQLYLGGLEEVRSNVSNVKTSCRDRVDDLEGQWSEFKHQYDLSVGKCSSTISRQVQNSTLDSISIFQYYVKDLRYVKPFT
jgi:hypothetical protein